MVAATTLLTCLDGRDAASQAGERPVRVLLVFQQQAETEPMIDFSRRLRLTIADGLRTPVEFYQESLDMDRFPGRERWASLTRFFSERYRGRAIDVVVPVGGVAFQFVDERLRDVFPGVPVVFALGVEPLVRLTSLAPNVTGRIAAPPRFSATLDMALGLQPDAKHVVVVGGSGPTDSASVMAAVGAATAVRDRLQLVVLQGLALDSLLNRLRHLPARSIVLFANFRRDGAGEAFDPVDVVGQLSRASSAPMYAQLRTYLGEGIVGGGMMSFDAEGARTGRLVLRVLRRPAGASMPSVETIGRTFAADWRALRRWGLSEQRLPPDTEVVFRQPSAWERYRALILGALVVIVGQAVLIVLLLLERRRRVRAQRAIRRGEELNRAVLASLSTQIAILDRQGTVIRVNEAWQSFARRAGVPDASSAFVGRNYLEECRRAEERGCESAREVRLGIESVLERRSWPFRHEYRWSVPDERWYELFVERLEHADGRAIVAHLDITDRRVAELHAEEARRQTAHIARVAMIGELAATLSHDLRQPLSAMRSNAQAGALWLTKYPEDLDTAKQIFRDIADEGVRASEVIDNVRMLLRKEQGSFVNVDLNEICRHAGRLLHGDAQLRHSRLELRLEPELPSIVGDPVQLQQVVLNLALNALDAASSRESPDRAVTIRTMSENGSVEVSVLDTGSGLPPDVERHLFEAFFSTKTSGLGLGLVIVRSIVDRHQGRVRAENHSSGGAIFRVQFPAGRAQAMDSARQRLMPERPVTAR